MKNLLDNAWWDAAATRAIRTFFQAFVATVGTAALMSEVNWLTCFSASALAAILSLATSLAGLPEVEGEKKKNE